MEEAIFFINKGDIECVVLDVNLKNGTSISIARTCVAKNISFMHLTGYGVSFLENSSFPKAEVMIKPILADQLVSGIKNLIKKQ